MNKVIRIIILVVIIPCTIISYAVIIDESITIPQRLYDHNYALDYTLLFPLLWSFLSIPTIILNFKILLKKKKEYLAIIDSDLMEQAIKYKISKLLLIGNLLFGLYVLITSVLILIIMQPRYPINQFWIGWSRYLVVLVIMVTGFTILFDKKNLGVFRKQHS